MQSVFRSNVSGWVGLAGAAGALVSVLTLSGCPGTLDPTLFTTGTGGSGGSGSGTGGSNPTGGSTGTGGAAVNCTGANDGATLVTSQCASPSGCHNTADAANFAAGLDLTINSTIASRLVDVTSPGDTAANSACGGNTEPYLKSGSNPATGLLVQKIPLEPQMFAERVPTLLRDPDALPGDRPALTHATDLHHPVGDDADIAMKGSMKGSMKGWMKSSMKGTMVSRTQLHRQTTVGRQQAHEGLVWAAAR